MPEGPVLKAWAHRFRRHIANVKGKVHGTRVSYFNSHLLRSTPARFIFYLRCFAMGTTVKDYVTCSVQQEEDYDPAIDLIEEDRPEHMKPSEMDRERSNKKPWEYLLESRLSGEFLVGVRGKILAIAAGHHLVFVNFGVGANVMPVSSEDYAAFAAQSQDIPGPNKSKQKANKMRSFAIPDQYKETQSTKADDLRRLNIFLAAVCSDGTVWLFVDHLRLIRFHVISRGEPWTAKDLEVESSVWKHAWDGKYGPDWFAHSMSPAYRLVPLEQLQRWKEGLLAEMAEGKLLSAPIASVISEDMVNFNGFGKHTAMDLLHSLRFLPHMPVSELVRSDSYFDRLRNCIFDYLAKFDKPAFFQKFAARVRVPVSVYNLFASAGLFDPLHTIGMEYTTPVVLAEGQYKYCTVYKYSAGDEGSGSVATYSIIQARPPRSWELDHWIKSEVTDDIRTVGLITTVGLAQFHQFNSNMIRYDENVKNKGGRPSTEHTGKSGRPRKSKTAAQLKKLAKRGQMKYVQKDSSEPVVEADPSTSTTQLPDSSNEPLVEEGMTMSSGKRKNESLPLIDIDCAKRSRTEPM
ncbi:hypothetical protein BDY19DRAFT_1059081 [Irpex rosettiformis]|uniref:Uncharacterized protein n=1 Tax=Irpex rosettiformis TaxID=378272 RepID=A0ACB8TW69_9APHY|nr:hypothetical protein BDY19DRAFT_1059081 [Irpex rosettiformis]